MGRYIANRLIQLHGQILWIDLDPGQAEFTLPGCLSCTIVKEPLLGPNFTHLANENLVINIYLGNFNVADVAQRYIKCVEYILQEINKRNPSLLQIPWIVNTMGFNRGLGINLLKKCMNFFAKFLHTTFTKV